LCGVSVCLIARNEEAVLPRCLASVADLGHELIVVDTGSTDRTREVARQLGARVFDFPWCDDFAAARNQCLRHATGDWIFWLDADEYFTDDNCQRLATLFAPLPDDNCAYLMQSRSLAAPGQPDTFVHQVRLFRRRPDIRWEYRVHEQVLPSILRAGGRVRSTDIVIEHAGYLDAAARGRKAQRNLRLLLLEDADRPGQPFTLLYLGWTYLELEQPLQALPFLQRSLQHAHPAEPFIRKLYTLIGLVHHWLGQRSAALAVCQAGLVRFPDDAELLLLEGMLLAEHGDLIGAEARFVRLLSNPGNRADTQTATTAHCASVSTGLHGFTTRQHLAALYRRQGRLGEAETQWRAALAEQPDFIPAWLGLGELCLTQQRWPELEQILQQVRRLPGVELEAVLLQARGHLVRHEFAVARQLLHDACARFPQAMEPRVLLAHALLQEDRDHAAAERALRDVLQRDPRHAESWRDLAALLRRQRRLPEALAACQSARAYCPADLDLPLLHGLLLRETGDLPGAESCLLRLLESLPPSPSPAVRNLACTARHNLGLVYHTQGRDAEAERQWRGVVAERPDFVAAWLALADACLAQGRCDEVEQIAVQLESRCGQQHEATVLRARVHLARREFELAGQLLDETIARVPHWLWPRVLLSHVLLQDGRDPRAAEQALRDVLALAPGHPEARHNLAVLLQQRSPGSPGS
jgi:tetratricopeptide (TPR) repeat protein